MENIIIPDKKRLEELKKNISLGGKDKLHILSDFDRTLTKAFVNSQKSSTVIAQIRNGDYISKEYSLAAHKLFDIYHPIEIDPNIDLNEKNSKMMEWWKKHFELLFRCGLNRQVMEKIVSKKELKFREKALEVIDFSNKNNIPLIIMSAGPGDMIKMYLEQEGRLYNNVQIIANMFKFDESGKTIGLRGKIIHSLNKDEAETKNLPIYNELKNRTNVILLGDGVEDIKMIKGFEYDNLIKIGFLNENIEENLEEFKKTFDIIITNDGSMEYVNKLLLDLF